MADALKNYSDLQLVRLTWCAGCSNIIRAKCIYAPSCKNWKKVTKEGVGLCSGIEAHTAMSGYRPPNSGILPGPAGELRLKPDWSTLTPVPYAKGHVRVMGNMYNNLVNGGERSQHCPRGFLQRMVDKAAERGYIIKAGYENEFILLQRTEDGSIKAVDDTVYCSTLSIDTNYEIMTDVIDALAQQGIEIELYHPETATGQQELSIRYTDVLKAADQQVIVRETVKAIALKHNRIATFIPCLWPDQSSRSNGCHIHFSIHSKDGMNLVPSPTHPNEISEVTSHFIAGILEHLKGIMTLSCPTTNSMRRIALGRNCGSYHMWGYDNRHAAIRVPSNGSHPSPTHFEFKASDTAGNPYFVLGVVIAAGLDGIDRKLPLQEPYQDNPGLLSEEEREKLNIFHLPSDLRETIDALSKDQVLLDALQPKLAKAILAAREFEYKTMKDMSLEEERKLLLQRF